MVTVSALSRYPLKSGAAHTLSQATVGPLGIEGDRRWMLVQPDGVFLTGRRFPHLSQLRAEETAMGLCLTLPSGASRQVCRPDPGGLSLTVTVWADRVVARRVVDAELNAWLSAWLGSDCLLVYLGEETRRPVDPTYGAPGDVVSFADGFPLLLLSMASLATLNGWLRRPVSAGHFRPNLVVEGAPPFAEDGWRHLQIGAQVRLEVVKPCARCGFVTVDPLSGTRDPEGEPLKTLSRHRRAAGGGVTFGQNVVVRQGGVIRVGDLVDVMG